MATRRHREATVLVPRRGRRGARDRLPRNRLLPRRHRGAVRDREPRGLRRPVHLWMTGYGEVGHFVAANRVDSASTCSSSSPASSCRRPSWPRSWRAGRGRGSCPSSATARVRLVAGGLAPVRVRPPAPRREGGHPGELARDVHVHGRPGRPPARALVGQTWTLRVDMTFYVLVPLAAAIGVRLVGTRLGVTGRRRAVWAGVAAAAAVPLTVAALVTETTATTRSPSDALFLFMPGVALAAALAGRRAGHVARWAAPVGNGALARGRRDPDGLPARPAHPAVQALDHRRRGRDGAGRA